MRARTIFEPKNLSAISLNLYGSSVKKNLNLPFLALFAAMPFSFKSCLVLMATCAAESTSFTPGPIIAFMEDEAEIRTALETAIEVQKKADDNLKANEERLKKKIEQVKKEIEEIRNKRNEIAKGIPTRIVKRYAALIKNKGRKAVAFNIHNACSGCGFNIRPQVVIEINEGNKINFCENCGRILVYKPESS